MSNKCHLFVFSISPVQPFIMQARKTEDSCSGSVILSEMCKSAFTELKALLSNTRIIFPAENNESLPNRFLAVIENAEPEKIKDAAQKIEKKIIADYVSQSCDLLTKKINQSLPAGVKEQLENYFSIKWAYISYQATYAETYKKLEGLQGAAKNIRSFEQIEETGRKCSVCGERNVKFYRLSGETENNVKNENGKLYSRDAAVFAEKESADFSDINPGEGLCAVCFAKRLYRKKKSFPSTANIALSDVLNRLNTGLSKIKSDYIKTVEGALVHEEKFDAQLYFEENLNETYFKKNGYADKIGQLKNIQKCHHQLKDELKKNDLKFTPYYAILVFDGDSMGKWLSGNLLKPDKKNELSQFHERLTQILGEYAKKAREIVQTPGTGVPVYAGGDDFLGFINLTRLFDTLIKLQSDFKKVVNLKEYSDKALTFSAGIAVVHYKTPLSAAIKKAREMEHKAKAHKNETKNAFALSIFRHSGQITETVYQWEEENLSTIEMIQSVCTYVKENHFSHNFIKTLHQELSLLTQGAGRVKNQSDISWVTGGEFDPEIIRMVKRSFMGNEENKASFCKDLSEKLIFLLKHSEKAEHFLALLDMVEFITRETNPW